MFTFTKLQRALSILISFGLLTVSLSLPVAWSDEGFGKDWVPKPLVNPQPPPKAANAPATPVRDTKLEEALKPAIPFISDVETSLQIKPKTTDPLAQRLSTIQSILFGGPKYNDAGELLAKLAEMFPKEASKANAQLMAQAQQNMPKAIVSPVNPSQVAAPALPVSPLANQQMAMPYAPPAPSRSIMPKKQKHDDFFDDDEWDREFDNSASRSSTGSALSGIGQSLSGIAMLAGSLAGTYFLNKKLGTNDSVNPAPYASYPYGYNPYNTPYMGGMPYGGLLPGTTGAYPQNPNLPYSPYYGQQSPYYGAPLWQPVPPTIIRSMPYHSSALGGGNLSY